MLEAGQVLQARYQLKQRLGQTAAGRQTWLSIDLHTPNQELVALKLLAFSPQMQWDELKLFEREAQILKALNHSRIPRYRDYFSVDQQVGAGLPWFGLVQDYIAGRTLQDLLNQGDRFTEKQVETIATEILAILIYLHELSPPVLHRDIKPSNLILGNDGAVYLVDFGAVQDRAAVTGMTFTVVGTCGYAPLEQFWGRAVPASDLYALGATLIHLLTGTNPADLPQRDSRIQFRDRVSLNSALVHWIEHLTDPAIEKRFATARQALAALTTGATSHAATPHTGSSRRSIRRVAPPVSSKIQVSRSSEQLDIVIPAPGEGRWRRTVVANFGLLLGIALSMGIYFPVGIGFLLAGIFVTAQYFGEKTRICFDHESFYLQSKILFFTFNRQQGKIADILGVFLYSQGRRSGEGVRLTIRIGEINLPMGRLITENEGLWLAQEIQTWLN